MTANVTRAPHLRVFDGLRRVWCDGPSTEPDGLREGCRRSVWVPLLSHETLCRVCRSFEAGR